MYQPELKCTKSLDNHDLLYPTSPSNHANGKSSISSCAHWAPGDGFLPCDPTVCSPTNPKLHRATPGIAWCPAVVWIPHPEPPRMVDIPVVRWRHKIRNQLTTAGHRWNKHGKHWMPRLSNCFFYFAVFHQKRRLEGTLNTPQFHHATCISLAVFWEGHQAVSPCQSISSARCHLEADGGTEPLSNQILDT